MLNYSTLQTLIQLVRMIADIGILWILLFYTIKIVRNNTRTAQIFKGIILILIIRAIANYFGFKAVDWLAGVLVTYGFLAIIIIFQPEIRTILERLGKNTFFSRLSTLSGTEREKLVDELVLATMNLSNNRVGALITIEQGVSLNDYIKTGTPINSLVNAELLNTIFLPNTPIHDGAVIIQGDRIACASAYFPPTNMIVPTRFGARHRAAIGISEITDSITIVVSEKSGRVSIAEEGKLVPVTQTELRNFLKQIILHGEEEVTAESTKKIIPEAPMDTPEVYKEDSLPESRSFFKRLFTPNPQIKPNKDVVAAEEKALKDAEVKRQKELLDAKKKAEDEAKLKAAEEKKKAQEEADRVAKELAKKEAEAKAKAEAEAKEIARKEAEAKAKAEQEAQELARIEAEAKAKAEQLALELAQKEIEEKERAEKEALELAQKEKEAQEKAEVEAKLKAEKEAEEKAKALELAQKAAETKAQKEAEEKAKKDAKAANPGFFARLLGRKAVVVEEVKEEVVVEEKVEEEIPVKKTRKRSTTSETTSTTSDKPKKPRAKKKVEAVVEETNVSDIEPIKDTPHVNFEFSVSDESLLDDTDFSNESKGDK